MKYTTTENILDSSGNPPDCSGDLGRRVIREGLWVYA